MTRAAQYLKAHDDFLVTTHVNADGDAISSALAVQYILKSFNKKSVIIINEPPQEKYEFLYGLGEIKIIDAMPSKQYKNVVTVDVPNISRTAAVKELIAYDAFIINIDHHGDNTAFGSINIYSNASSTAEHVYRLIKALDIPITRDLAEMIYTGIIFDTGMFRFSNTTEHAFAISAELRGVGARIDMVAEKVFFTKDECTMKLFAHVLNSLEMHNDGKVGFISVTDAEIKKFCENAPDMDDYINNLMLTKGIEVGAFIIESEKDFYRVSLRSKNEFNVQQVASAFSGGGHRKASGCKLKGSLEEVKGRLLAQISKYLTDAP